MYLHFLCGPENIYSLPVSDGAKDICSLALCYTINIVYLPSTVASNVWLQTMTSYSGLELSLCAKKECFLCTCKSLVSCHYVSILHTLQLSVCVKTALIKLDMLWLR